MREEKGSIVQSQKTPGGTVDEEGTNVWMAILSLAKDRLGDISLRRTNNNLTLPKHNKFSKETHAI